MMTIPWWSTGCDADDDDDDDDDDSSGDDDDSAGDDDDTSGDDDDDSSAMPPDPTPFTVTFSGGSNESIVFSDATCEVYPSPSNVNYRHFWRDPSHNAVLIAEVLGAYTGPGTYDQTMNTVRIKLQAEAPLGSPYDFYYGTDTAQGDTVTISVTYAEPAGVTWGEFTFNSISGDGGSVTASPLPIPLWCDNLMN
jgi:hypothetical protein